MSTLELFGWVMWVWLQSHNSSNDSNMSMLSRSVRFRKTQFDSMYFQFGSIHQYIVNLLRRS